MKRIYLCCILLILMLGLATLSLSLRTEEGFQTAATRTPLPTTIKCSLQAQTTGQATSWFCEDKNQADALLAPGTTYVLPTDAVCIRKSSQSSIYTCLERNREDKRYLLNRQQKTVCDFIGKNLKNVETGIDTGTKLRKIAQDTLNTIVTTEPNIQILKTRNPGLSGYLDEKKSVIESQKAILRGYESSLSSALDNNNNFRSLMNTTLSKMKCE